MRLLQFCHKLPNPPIDGGAQLVHYTTLGMLKNGIDVTVFAINPSRVYVDPVNISPEYKEQTKLVTVQVDTGLKLSAVLRNLFSEESYFIERFRSDAVADRLIDLLSKNEYDIIQLEHLYLCRYLDILRKHSRAKIILRAQNVEYVIWERYLKNLFEPAKRIFISLATRRLKKFEQSAIEKLDGLFALTKEDAKEFKSFSGKTPIDIVPMGFDYAKVQNYNYESQYDSDPIVIYHLGSMDWLPNQEGVKWFLKKVYPILKQRNPGQLKIVLAGRKMPAWVYEYQSSELEVIAEVINPIEFQIDKPVMIVPLLSGSGIRAKIIEGLALGKTIISTTVGAQGIEVENEKNILIADSPEDFAIQILKCIESKECCKQIGRNALELGRSKYDMLQTASKMIDFYRRIN